MFMSSRAYPARKVPKAPKEWKAHSALMANLVHRVLRAHRDLLVRSVEWDHQECRDRQVNACWLMIRTCGPSLSGLFLWKPDETNNDMHDVIDW